MSPPDDGDIAAANNFRVRVAAERREKMRSRLLDALLALYQPGRHLTHLVIDDVTRIAGVSRGTFYKYFESIEEAVGILGERLTSEMIADFSSLFADEKDAAARAVGGASLPILRTWQDPSWGGFTCRIDLVDYFARCSAFDGVVRACLEEARTQGQLQFRSLDAAVDLIIGMTIEARRRLIRGIERPRIYAEEMLEHTFAGLGMPAPMFLVTRDKAWGRILAGAPTLNWWPRDNGWLAEI